MTYKNKIKKTCKQCNKEFMAFKNSKGLFCGYKCSTIFKNTGNKHSEETKRKIGTKSKIRTQGDNNTNWKGGVSKNNIPLYDTYAHQISFAEQVRRNKEDRNILEVKCTYCKEWYIPKQGDVRNRLNSLNGNMIGYSEYRLYCSSECKHECPVYGQHYYLKGEKPYYHRDTQSQLREMVLERDDYQCVKCESKEDLICHHKEGIRWEPLESADIDQCITYCKHCHKDAHEKEGCRTVDMQCREIL